MVWEFWQDLDGKPVAMLRLGDVDRQNRNIIVFTFCGLLHIYQMNKYKPIDRCCK